MFVAKGCDCAGLKEMMVKKNDMTAAPKAGANLQAPTALSCADHQESESQENLLSV